MEVITIESEAFQEILRNLEEIKGAFSKKQKLALGEQWLTNQEVAKILNVSKRTLQNYRDEGIISFSQVGSKIYYNVADIEEHLKKHRVKAFKSAK